MSDQIEIRYRCVVCDSLVKIGHIQFSAMFHQAIVYYVRGNDNFEGDFIALVCELCRATPEKTTEALESSR